MRTKTMFVFGIITFLAISLFTVVSGNSHFAAAPAPIPSQEASVRFTFDGMIALCFGNAERVSAGFLDAHHHTPELKIVKIENNKKSEIAVLDAEQLRNKLFIDVEGGPSTGVSRYYGESMSSDENDFRWNIDLENDLHQRQLYVNEKKLWGKIHFNTGLFYAGEMTERPVQFFAADNSGKVLPFNRRIAQPEAKVNLAMGQTLVIRGGEQVVRLTAQPGVRYEVEITNLPPKSMASMDHFLMYYDVIDAKVTKYSPIQVKKAVFAGGPVMCGVAVFSRSQLD